MVAVIGGEALKEYIYSNRTTREALIKFHYFSQ